MHNWFECKVKYERQAEDGRLCTVSEKYLVDALSHTEAEARITKEITSFVTGEFSVAGIRPMNITELFPSATGDKWWRAKVNFITLDEYKGIEKRTPTTILVQADTLREAIEVLEKGMKGTLADYEIASVVGTNILDIFVNIEEEPKNEKEKKKSTVFQRDECVHVYCSQPEICKEHGCQFPKKKNND